MLVSSGFEGARLQPALQALYSCHSPWASARGESAFPVFPALLIVCLGCDFSTPAIDNRTASPNFAGDHVLIRVDHLPGDGQRWSLVVPLYRHAGILALATGSRRQSEELRRGFEVRRRRTHRRRDQSIAD